MLRTRLVRSTATYALTSPPTNAARPEELAQLWRGHWTIENRVHYVRDITFGEDAHQMHTGNVPQVLAAHRNALVNRLRAVGWTNIAAALRHYANAVPEAIQLIGVPAT